MGRNAHRDNAHKISNVPANAESCSSRHARPSCAAAMAAGRRYDAQLRSFVTPMGREMYYRY